MLLLLIVSGIKAGSFSEAAMQSPVEDSISESMAVTSVEPAQAVTVKESITEQVSPEVSTVPVSEGPLESIEDEALYDTDAESSLGQISGQSDEVQTTQTEFFSPTTQEDLDAQIEGYVQSPAVSSAPATSNQEQSATVGKKTMKCVCEVE